MNSSTAKRNATENIGSMKEEYFMEFWSRWLLEKSTHDKVTALVFIIWHNIPTITLL